MTIWTTLRVTCRNHRFLAETVDESVVATRGSAVAVALEQMTGDDEECALAVAEMTAELRARLGTQCDELSRPRKQSATLL